ncbi:MAG TPA: hypothetical protein DCX06_10990 [Opitutae bacterium]|nr:hypothetical protein [Opitutae bacterium]
MYKNIITLLACLLISCAHASDLSKSFAKLKSDDYDARLNGRIEVKQIFADASAPDADVALVNSLEDQVNAELGGSMPLSGRLYLIRMLELFGSAQSAGILYPLLGDDEEPVRDSARRALSEIPGEEATNYLLNGLARAPKEERRGYMDGLVERGAVSAAPEIANLLGSDDLETVTSAALAIGKLGNQSVIPALLDAHSTVTAEAKESIELALLHLGVDADTAYLLSGQGSNEAIRVAAFQQLCELDTARAGTVLQAVLNKPEIVGGERFLAAAMKNDFAQAYLVNALPKATAADQFVIITAVGEHGLSQYENQVLALGEDLPTDLKIARVDTLSRIGGDASFEVIYDAFVADPKDVTLVAAVSRLRAPAADQQALATAKGNSDLAKRVTAMKVLELRNTTGATELLNTIALGDGDEKAREAAFKSLEVIGDLESIKVLVQLVVSNDSLARSAQRSLKRLTLNYGAGDYLWEQVFEPALQASQNDDAREGLILILDGVVGEKTLAYLSRILLDFDSPLRSASERTLARWPNLDVGYVWIDLASAPGAPSEDAASAVKALTKMLSKSNPKQEVEQMKLAAAAIQKVNNPDLRETILSVYKKPNGRQKRRLKAYFKYLEDDPEVGSLIKPFLSKL